MNPAEHEPKRNLTGLAKKLTELISETFPSMPEQDKLDTFYPIQEWLFEYNRGQFVGTFADLISKITTHLKEVGFSPEEAYHAGALIEQEFGKTDVDFDEEHTRA